MISTAPGTRRTMALKPSNICLSDGSIDLPYVLAVGPDGLVALELVDDAHPRPTPWSEHSRATNRIGQAPPSSSFA